MIGVDGFPAGDVPDTVIEEARQLAEAVSQIRGDQGLGVGGLGGQGGVGGVGGVGGGIIERRREESLPCFFVITASPSVEVRSAPSNSSLLIRTINKVHDSVCDFLHQIILILFL